MSDLALAPMVASYNGFVFSVHALVEIQARPMPTSDGRGIKYVKYDVSVKDVIGQANQSIVDGSTDATLVDARQRLCQNGCELIVDQTGFGRLWVNPVVAPAPIGGPPAVPPVGSTRDAVWGPKPTMLRWAGCGNQSAEIVWTCEVCVAECPISVPLAGDVVEWNAAITWAVGKGGYQTRTVEGHVTIAQTRLADPFAAVRPTDAADRLREAVANGVRPLRGFRRSYGPWKLDASKCTLSFSVVDAETGDSSDNYPPAGVVEVDASHSVTFGGPGFAGMATGQIAATYEVARTTPKTAAFAAFLSLVNQRKRSAPGAFLRKSLALTEPAIYGKGEGTKAATFAMTYTFSTTLAAILGASGLYRRVEGVAGGDWQRWATSLAPSAFHARGHAGLRFVPGGGPEAIIDLCHQGDFRIADASAAGGRRPRGIEVLAEEGEKEEDNEVPPAESSWLAFQSVIRLEPQDSTLALQPLPPAPPLALDRTLATARAPLAASGDDFGPSLAAASSEATRPLPSKAAGLNLTSLDEVAAYSKGVGNDVVIQVRSSPTYRVVLRGYAARAGYLISPPAVASVGGVAALPQNRHGRDGFEHWLADSWFGLPIFMARWHFTYVLAGTPSGVLPIMQSPAAGR